MPSCIKNVAKGILEYLRVMHCLSKRVVHKEVQNVIRAKKVSYKNLQKCKNGGKLRNIS